MRSTVRAYARHTSTPVACVGMHPGDEPSSHYGGGTEKLSQLSDIVSLSQDNEHSLRLQNRAESLSCAQDSLLDFVEDLPSQAVLPTPELPFATQRNNTSGACEAQDLASDIPSEIAAKPDMPSVDDEQCYVPERTKSGKRATRRGCARRSPALPVTLQRLHSSAVRFADIIPKYAGRWTR